MTVTLVVPTAAVSAAVLFFITSAIDCLSLVCLDVPLSFTRIPGTVVEEGLEEMGLVVFGRSVTVPCPDAFSGCTVDVDEGVGMTLGLDESGFGVWELKVDGGLEFV